MAAGSAAGPWLRAGAWRLLRLGRLPALGMDARVDDAVHIEVEVVELHPVWVGSREVERGGVAFGGVDDNLWVLLRAPAEEGGDAHCGGGASEWAGSGEGRAEGRGVG